MNFETLTQEAEALRKSWDELIELVRPNWNNFGQPMAVINGLSAHDLDRGFRVSFDLLMATMPASPESPEYAVWCARHQDIKVQIQALQSQITTALNNLKPIWREGSKILSTDAQFGWGLEEAGTRYANVNLNPQFQNLGLHLASWVAMIGQVVPLCSTKFTGDLSARTEAFSKLLGDIQPLYADAKSLVRRSIVATNKNESIVVGTEALAKQAEADFLRLRELLKSATTDHAQVSATAERAQQISVTSETLAQAVIQYQTRFDDFRTSLDERLADLADFENRSRDADKRNADYEKNIQSLILQSEEMLKGSTTVGLAKSMEEARARYETRMNSTRTGFYWSVAFLLVSALPLAIHLIPGLVDLLPWMTGKDGVPKTAPSPAADANPYAVLGKVILLLPATWLTAFFTRTYAQLFQLEREYAHKAALAASVHGFKLQAKKYEEEITAEVFMEIRMNPAHGPTVDAASHPLYDVLAKTVGKVMDKMSGGSDANLDKGK